MHVCHDDQINRCSTQLGASSDATKTNKYYTLNYSGSGMPVAQRIFLARSKVPTEV